MTATVTGLALIGKLVYRTFPAVNHELSQWRKYVLCHSRGILQEQALASLREKKFHCLGGSVFSLYPEVDPAGFLRLIVAFQTVSDYLDNLCDRTGLADETAFYQLHLAITDALNPETTPADYYQFYPYKEDGGYLVNLVTLCRQEIQKLPSYSLVQGTLLHWADLYSRLQTYKHLAPDFREEKMVTWLETFSRLYPEATIWELAAATGSTLGMFMLCAAAANPTLTKTELDRIRCAYFPWINGFHILLDYFIDAAEDRLHGDLNFVSYYGNDRIIPTRLLYFFRQSLRQARPLSRPDFTETVIHGLLAFYLSDPKTNTAAAKEIKRHLLNEAGFRSWLLYQLCLWLRRKKLL
ncbi:Hypothetical protein LUCI_2147 [Lucifera butyrica]|uniref:Tetraprenyl-beta-curcumene synthase n=1 Tax=Lucifera butyrica TaxID=1351585 RepID=A0A498R7M6_9FIRM|nr:Hypothetical protein LUCI_2147 [Lucifera butyrica]